MRFINNFSIALALSLFFLSFSWGAPIVASSDDTDLAVRGLDSQSDIVPDLVARAPPHQFNKAVLLSQARRKDKKDGRKDSNLKKSQAEIRDARKAGKDARRQAYTAKVKPEAQRAKTKAAKAQRRQTRKKQSQPSPPNKAKNEKNQMKAEWRQLDNGGRVGRARREDWKARTGKTTLKNAKIAPGGSFPEKKPVVRTSTKPKRGPRSLEQKKKARKARQERAKDKKDARPKYARPVRDERSSEIKAAAAYMKSTINVPKRGQQFKYKRVKENIENVRNGVEVRKGIMNGELFKDKKGTGKDPSVFKNNAYAAGHPLAGKTPLGPAAAGGREFPVTTGNLGYQRADGQDRDKIHVRVITSEGAQGSNGKPRFEGLLAHDPSYGPKFRGDHYKMKPVKA